MNTADTIRHAVAQVEVLRQESRGQPDLGTAVLAVKRFQARRFAGTYADLLAGGPYAAAARFFLEELYGDRDYADRDAQFARIAGAVERLFPKEIAQTAADLAQLHALTESLDHDMARVGGTAALSDAARYVAAWRAVGRRADRERQLQRVLAIGSELARLTRLPGLRLMLKMMRRPASAAGLTALQLFLESGFDTFAGMSKSQAGAQTFLGTIGQREERLLQMLFDAEAVACETELARTLGQAR